MPRLLLLRHAKAEPSARGGAKDFDRALSERGVAESQRMGKRIAERGDSFDLVLCSSSVRTRQTWDGVRQALAGAPEPQFLRELYDGEASYIDIVRARAAAASAVLVIGHNPSMQATAVELASDLSGEDGTALKRHFPPAALAVLEFAEGWADLAPRTARLVAFVQPG